MRYLSQRPGAACTEEIRHHFKEIAEQSEALLEHDFEMAVEYCGEVIENNWTGDKFVLTLTNRRTGRQMVMQYKTGIGHRKVNLPKDKREEMARCALSVWAEEQRKRYTVILPPSPLGVLHCIRLDDPHGYTFSEWCEDLGYDTDSRKALEMYLACQETTVNFRRTFPGFNLDEYKPLEDY